MKDFDEDTPGGKQLNADLKRLAKVMGGQARWAVGSASYFQHANLLRPLTLKRRTRDRHFIGARTARLLPLNQGQ